MAAEIVGKHSAFDDKRNFAIRRSVLRWTE